jgi:hypothetical protein
MNTLYDVYRDNFIWIRAFEVPGGFIFTTGFSGEDNSTAGITSCFVPMSRSDSKAFIDDCER